MGKPQTLKGISTMYIRLIALSILLAGQLTAQMPIPPAAPSAANSGTLTAPSPKPAPASSGTVTPQQRNPLEVKVQQLQQDLRERDAIIRNLLERVGELEKKVNGKPLEAVPVAATLNKVSADTAAVAVTPSDDGYDEEERKARAALDRTLVSQGGLLLRPGQVEMETSMSYYNSSANSISINGFSILPVLVVGNIQSSRIRRDMVLSNEATRLGLPGNFQLDVQTPYGYELVRTVQADGTQSSQSARGFGDLDVALTRQLTKERGSMPDLLASVDFKSKTGKDPFDLGTGEVALGSGFYGLRGRVTAVKSSDPMVFFGSMAYTHNFSADKLIADPNNAGQQISANFTPGDTIGFQLGSVLSVNPEASITFGYDQSFTRATNLNDKSIPGTYLSQGTLRVGGAYIFAPGRTIDLSLGIGLTPDVPNLQFTVGLPLRFSLWGSNKNK